MSYKNAAWRTLGDEWLERNREELKQYDAERVDPVAKILQELRLKPKAILEVGCSNGWRLRKLRQLFGCYVLGIDPSPQAVSEANEPNIIIGMADDIPAKDGAFDVVVLGFFLFLVPPEDLFKVVAETSRVLADNGYLIIYDFLTPRPFKRKYRVFKEHQFYSYFVNWERLWIAHPGYKKIWEAITLPRWEGVIVIKKDFAAGFPEVADKGFGE
jgi:SAM-dependent methyltransferase